jgi:hypothetical protein
MNLLLLFAEAESSVQPWWSRILLNGESLAMLVGLVAVIGGIIWTLMTSVMRHRERMAMIQQGMNPDEPPKRGIPRESR